MSTIAGSRILLADSSRETADIIRQLLMREGAYLLLLNNGDNLLRGLDIMPPPELVLFSMELPGESGLQVTRQLRQHAVWQHTPVMLIGAQNDGTDIQAAFQAGADDFLRKPLSPAELMARIKKLLFTRANPRHDAAVQWKLD